MIAMKTIVVILALMGSNMACIASMNKLIDAVVHVESHGNVDLVGDNGNAIGPMQIWKSVVDDINSWSDMKFTYDDRRSLQKSKQMFKLYVKHYGTKSRLNRQPTMKDYARIWNGGPNGHKKTSTITYWNKVKRHSRCH